MERKSAELNSFESLAKEYLEALSEYKPHEYKIVVIGNAGFHSTKHIQVPQNIFLLNIPPYSPELNPCEQIWQFIIPALCIRKSIAS